MTTGCVRDGKGLVNAAGAHGLMRFPVISNVGECTTFPHQTRVHRSRQVVNDKLCIVEPAARRARTAVPLINADTTFVARKFIVRGHRVRTAAQCRADYYYFFFIFYNTPTIYYYNMHYIYLYVNKPLAVYTLLYHFSYTIYNTRARFTRCRFFFIHFIIKVYRYAHLNNNLTKNKRRIMA